MEHLVIYRLGSLGDTVVALPCFHLVERAFPHAERILLTNITASSRAAPVEAILKPGGFIHGTIRYPVGVRNPVALARLARTLRRLEASTLVYLTESRGLAAARRDVGYFRLAGFRRIIGAPVTRDLQLNRSDPNGNLERESHRLARCLAELGRIDLGDPSWWDLRLTGSELDAGRRALGSLADQPFVGVNTGIKILEKDWGEGNWSALLDRLGDHFPGYGLVFVGASDDSERAERLARRWRAGPVADLCGRLEPRESAAALTRARLFVSHDSGPLHLADAVGTPAVGLFGAYNRPEQWHPNGLRTRIIHRMEGLAKITPDEVTEIAVRLVAQTSAPL